MGEFGVIFWTDYRHKEPLFAPPPVRPVHQRLSLPFCSTLVLRSLNLLGYNLPFTLPSAPYRRHKRFTMVGKSLCLAAVLLSYLSQRGFEWDFLHVLDCRRWELSDGCARDIPRLDPLRSGKEFQKWSHGYGYSRDGERSTCWFSVITHLRRGFSSRPRYERFHIRIRLLLIVSVILFIVHTPCS